MFSFESWLSGEKFFRQSADSAWGKRPVNIDACDGNVHDAVERACSKRTPSRIQRSISGVVGREYP